MKSSSYLSLSFVIHLLFSSILNLEGSQRPRVVPSAIEKSFASLGDGPYKLPNKKEELSSALGSLNVEYLAKAVNSIRN